jgi:hypothetical protein
MRNLPVRFIHRTFHYCFHTLEMLVVVGVSLAFNLRIFRYSSRCRVREETPMGPSMSVCLFFLRNEATPMIRGHCWNILFQQRDLSLLEHIIPEQWEPRSLLEHVATMGPRLSLDYIVATMGTEVIIGSHYHNNSLG